MNDVYITIRRCKTTLHLAVNENALIVHLKNQIACLIKKSVKDQQLVYEGRILDDKQKLVDCGLTANVGTISNHVEVGLILRMENGEFELLDITPYSSPSTVIHDANINQEEHIV